VRLSLSLTVLALYYWANHTKFSDRLQTTNCSVSTSPKRQGLECVIETKFNQSNHQGPTMAPGNIQVLGRRVVALLIDVIAASILPAIVFITSLERFEGGAAFGVDTCPVPGYNTCFTAGNDVYLGNTGNSWLLLGLLSWLVIRIAPQALTGKTLGKKMLGLKVLKADGSLPGWGGSILRELLWIIDGIFFYAVGFIIASVSDTKQRLGDKVASTFVVRDDGSEILAPPPPGAFGAAPPPMSNMAPPAATTPPSAAAAPPPTGSGPGADLAPPMGATPPPAATPAPTPVSSDPVWDADRGVYVHTDPASGARKVYDNATSTWRDDN
jgi:uncharacterized RDD family membrane protein YckC